MNSPAPISRHLSAEGFSDYLRSGAPSVIKLVGLPPVYLIIEPAIQRIALRSPLSGQVPDLADYQHISATSIFWNDDRWCELRIEGEIVPEGYPVLCAVADRIQLRSLDFGAAVTDALASLRDLLASRSRLSGEQEIGLFGELTVLKRLLKELPATDALRSWQGPDGEEHDFVLADGDVEVKTTVSEDRCHWITHIRQLEPTVDRELWLLSVQLTGSGAGGASLAGLIDELKAQVPDGEPSDIFKRKLATVNWRDATAALYTKRFRLRSQPIAYRVDDAFPSLTPKRFEGSGMDLSRIAQVRYKIDLRDLSPSPRTPSTLSNIGSEV